jgi:signal transduction histidine kinase
MGTWQGRLAWSLCAGTVVAAAVQVALLASSGAPMLTRDSFLVGFPTTEVTAIVAAAVAALIITRYPRHPIGWLFAGWACGVAVGLVADGYLLRQVRGDNLGHGGLDHLAIAAAIFFNTPYTLALGAILFLLAPDGRLPSRRWWPALALPMLGLGLNLATAVTVDPAHVLPGRVMGGQVGPLTVTLGVAGTITVLIAVPIAAYGLVRRLRLAHGEQRQQLRWIAASGVALAVTAAIAITATALSWGGPSPWPAVVPVLLAYVSVPVCTAVAILRYRLYDIDVIINRAVVLLTVAAFVTVGYLVAVLSIVRVLGQAVPATFWPSLLAMAVVALAFQPLRSRVLRWADRVVYGARAQPYQTLAEFSRRIGATASPDDLLPTIAQLAAGSVRAVRATVQLDVPGAERLCASWPAGTENNDRPTAEFTVADHGQHMGVLTVTMPPGRPLRRDDQRLLAALAAHAGIALRNLRLDAELRSHVREAAAQSSALEASNRRLLGARDAERERMAATIDRAVLARLQPLISALQSDAGTDAQATTNLVERLDTATEAALDELRQVTHGLLPAVLTRRGVVPALRAHLAAAGPLDILEVDDPVEQTRFPNPTETSAYFCCVTALAWLERPRRLRLTLSDRTLVIDITGTVTQATRTPTIEQAWIVDRVEAVGGRLRRHSDPSGTLTLHIEIPSVPTTGSADK